ncbi:hypothetical protein K438DRAFT_1759196 [Mycena galopus ATCC 62051]|nr:hypothetical protein K438DRAFT_1759196 [Mycena galopus ATCC 62051]
MQLRARSGNDIRPLWACSSCPRAPLLHLAHPPTPSRTRFSVSLLHARTRHLRKRRGERGRERETMGWDEGGDLSADATAYRQPSPYLAVAPNPPRECSSSRFCRHSNAYPKSDRRCGTERSIVAGRGVHQPASAGTAAPLAIFRPTEYLPAHRTRFGASRARARLPKEPRLTIGTPSPFLPAAQCGVGARGRRDEARKRAMRQMRSMWTVALAVRAARRRSRGAQYGLKLGKDRTTTRRVAPSEGDNLVGAPWVKRYIEVISFSVPIPRGRAGSVTRVQEILLQQRVAKSPTGTALQHGTIVAGRGVHRISGLGLGSGSGSWSPRAAAKKTHRRRARHAPKQTVRAVEREEIDVGASLALGLVAPSEGEQARVGVVPRGREGIKYQIGTSVPAAL